MKILTNKVARLHLEKGDVKLTKPTRKQTNYIGVPAEGSYKARLILRI
jgi:S-adenosylhomocysteine hydrolase